jgi:hypothetical protein
MKSLFCLATLGVLSVLPLAANATMTPSMVGVGPHGYDWLIGSWSCQKSMPTAMSGPAATTLTVTRGVNGTLPIHISGTNFDSLAYTVYDPKTKTWWNPSIYSSGDYSTESSAQTGVKTLWTGLYYHGSTGKSMQIRDTYTMVGMTKFSDLSQAQVGGVWKTQASTTCSKS